MLKKNISKILFALLVPCLLTACGKKKKNKKQKQSAQKTSPSMTTADYVKQASFVTLEGDTVTVADFKGKVVMIDFWETWCKPCISSFPTIQKLQEKYPDRFISLAVTPGFSDTKKDAKAFKKSHDYSFIYALDSSNLHKKLKVRRIPFKIFIAANGKFIKTSLGSAGAEQDFKKIEKIIKKYSSSS